MWLFGVCVACRRTLFLSGSFGAGIWFPGLDWSPGANFQLYYVSELNIAENIAPGVDLNLFYVPELNIAEI